MPANGWKFCGTWCPHLADLANTQYPGRLSEIADIRAAARKLGLDVAVFEIRQVEEIGGVFETALKQRAEALYVVGDTVLNSNRVRVATLAMNARLPTMFGSQDSVEAGGLMSYGANIPHLFKRGAELVDKILRGTKPGDIPVEQPTTASTYFMGFQQHPPKTPQFPPQAGSRAGSPLVRFPGKSLVTWPQGGKRASGLRPPWTRNRPVLRRPRRQRAAAWASPSYFR